MLVSLTLATLVSHFHTLGVTHITLYTVVAQNADMRATDEIDLHCGGVLYCLERGYDHVMFAVSIWAYVRVR